MKDEELIIPLPEPDPALEVGGNDRSLFDDVLCVGLVLFVLASVALAIAIR